MNEKFGLIRLTLENHHITLLHYAQELNELYRYLSQSIREDVKTSHLIRCAKTKIEMSNEIYLLVDNTRNGRLVGTVTLLCEHKMYGSFCGKTVLHLEDLVVHPDYQGQGAGILLTNLCRDRMKEVGAAYITLRCSDHVRGFYEKLGYEDAGCSMKLVSPHRGEL